MVQVARMLGEKPKISTFDVESRRSYQDENLALLDASNHTDAIIGSTTRLCFLDSDFATAVFNITSGVMGAGILGLPRALADSGWQGLFFLVLVTAIEAYTGILISDLLNFFPNAKSYSELGIIVAGNGEWVDMLTLCDGIIPLMQAGEWPFLHLKWSNAVVSPSCT